MGNNPNEVLLEGRIVKGHPMTRKPVMVKDKQTGVESKQLDNMGRPVTEMYCAIAIPKNGSTDWRATPWGQKTHGLAVAAWSNGEPQNPAFSNKIDDGDSAIPNKKQKKPCDQEGYPGHWVVHCSTQFAVRCHHVGKYDPSEQIQDEKKIKTGDYGRLLIEVKKNTGDTPGMYMNPILFELSRAGQLIITQTGTSAADAFGGDGANVDPNAQVDNAVGFSSGPGTGDDAPPPPPPPGGDDAPPPPEVRRMLGGKAYTEAKLLASKYSQAQIDALPIA